MKKLLVLACLLFIGCTHAVTSTKTENPYLQPQTLKGPIEDIYEVAFKAAERAFPEEIGEDIRKEEGWKVIVERGWFWRGDTTVTVTVDKVGDDEFIVSAESKASWKRANPCMAGCAEQDLKYYGKALAEEYAEYKKPKSTNSENKTLSDRLMEIKQALDEGMITQSEYEAKKAEILKGY